MTDTPRSRTSGIDRSLQILDALTEANRQMSAYELCKAIGAPQSTVYRLVDELVERGMLTRRDDMSIWLGPRVMRYGLCYRASVDVFAEARREMRRLSAQINETIQLCTRDDGMMTVIAMVEGAGHFRITSDVGTRVPLNWTASGRLLLGHLSDSDRLAAFAQSAQPSPTGKAETNPEVLARQSATDFQRGLAIQMGQSEYAVACIAAPIRDEKGRCAATISIVLTDQQAQTRINDLAVAVQSAARRIERAIGCADSL